MTDIMTASVSIIESFRWWEQSEQDWTEFLEHMTAPQTPQMKAGQVFHSCLEHAAPAEYEYFERDGYSFDFAPDFDGEIPLGQIHEIPCSKLYGPLLVRGRVDDILGNVATDYKVTFSSFDAEKYLESYQWRLYLDMISADVFTYQVFEMYDGAALNCYTVKKLHTLRQYRYPNLHSDCARLVSEFYAAALIHPEISKMRSQEEL